MPRAELAKEKRRVLPIGTSNPKIDAVLHQLDECSVPVVIPARFTAEVDALAEAIAKEYPEYTCEKIHGGVHKTDRAQIVERYKAGSVDILVASSGTIAMGYNLQRAHTMLIYSNNYSALIRGQLEDRLHRIGQTESVLYMDFVMRGTVDEKIYAALLEKKELLDYIRSPSIDDFLGGIQ